MARPTKLDDEVLDNVVTALKLGATYELAAAFAGISYDSFNNYRKRGEKEFTRRESPRVQEGTKTWEREEPFFQFFEAVKLAEGEAAIGWLAKIEAAASEKWQAAAWKLERRYPQDYGRRVDVTSGDEPVRVLGIEVVAPDDAST